MTQRASTGAGAVRRPSRVLVGVVAVGALVLTGALLAAGSGPQAGPWPVQVVLWAAFVGLRHDAAQRWLAGGGLDRRTARRVLFGQALGAGAVASSALPALVPVVCLLVAVVHVEWRWRRALEAGGLGTLVLSGAATAGVSAGVLPSAHGTAEQAAALGLACLVLANVAVLARQRERADAALEATRRTRHDELLHAAQHDALTGLLGRRGTADALAAACAAAAPGALAAVVFCDLDGFKPVNDAHGHAVGDRLLVDVARRLAEAAGPSAQVGRTGGDEFVVVLGGAHDTRAVETLAARVRDCLDEPVEVDGLVLALGLSSGCAWSDAPVPGEELLRRADTAMYAAKAQRRAGRSAARPTLLG
ncbi:diguanylate cyclase domain-containing protein [Quadrisphaera oryzae]|uniref:diguanylate cyclase domain-containing protein n=1 Tax=Quadrisphaera TaxID=317661 RepID=UPI0016476A1E|nr:GGDEF domain-containing protein [Quadrisphaera sp. RL12-1S]